MSTKIVENFEQNSRFKDDNEALIIRQKLEQLVSNILAQVTKRDGRLQSTLIHSGSVYEGVKVGHPDEFDFMVRIDSLTNKPLLRLCDNVEGYVKLVCNDARWGEFADEEGFFNPNLLSGHFKRLVNESWSAIEVPEGLVIQQTDPRIIRGPWGPVYAGLVGGERNLSNVMYIESHGPATTLKIVWQGGSSYKNLEISVDLTLSLEYDISKLHVQLSKVPEHVTECLQREGFHLVPAGFDMWRISFSMVEKQLLSSAPDRFKTCYRVLKYVRDDTSQILGIDPSLVPSYIFKCVLLGQLFSTDEHAQSWEEELLVKVERALKAVLQGIKERDIQSFFISGYNLLSMADHSNRLRQFLAEDMLNRVRGLKMKHTTEEVDETKKQIRVLQMIDVVEYLICSALTGKDPSVLWRKMFMNIDDVPVVIDDDIFLSQVTDLDRLELDGHVYERLVQIWSAADRLFQQLEVSLPEELKILAQKFYIRTCEKRRHFELTHKETSKYVIQQIPAKEVAVYAIMKYADDYLDERGANAKCFSNLHKAIPPEHRPLGLLQDVASVTMNEGSEKGRAKFKERLEQYLSMVPESVLISVAVGYVTEIFQHGKEVLTKKLEYITIPKPSESKELELD